jgi:hypothetical protein
MDGTYGFVYCGHIGVGMGVFTIADSDLVGVDFAGARYRGRVTPDKKTGLVDLSFEMAVPPGISLVQGTSPQELPYTKKASVKVAPNFADGKPFEVYVAPGPVTMMVRRIPDDYAYLAGGFTLTIQPLGFSRPQRGLTVETDTQAAVDKAADEAKKAASADFKKSIENVTRR